MSALAQHLQDLRPQLVQRAVYALTQGETVRPMLEVEVLRFFERLIAAVESGSLDWLQGLMRDWVAVRPMSVGHERQTFIPILHILRSATWETLSITLSAEEALRGGLVNLVVAPEALKDAARDIAATLAQKSRAVLALGKKAFYAQLTAEQQGVFDAEAMLGRHRGHAQHRLQS